MRHLTNIEAIQIAGGDLHTHVVLQPTGPITRDAFRSDMVVIGMMGGALVGSVIGTLAVPVAGTIVGCAAGLLPGGVAGRAVAEFSLGVYDLTMLGTGSQPTAA